MIRKVVSALIFVIILAGAGAARDLRAIKIEKFLSKYPASPLHGHTDELVNCADHFGLDYRLYAALAGAESTFGRRYPKSNHNLTGVVNGDKRFASIYDNIYKTNELIATGKWYRRYRRTKNIKDLVYVYKGAPPYTHYLKTVRYIFWAIDKMSVESEMLAARRNSLVAWNAVRYDSFPLGLARKK